MVHKLRKWIFVTSLVTALLLSCSVSSCFADGETGIVSVVPVPASNTNSQPQKKPATIEQDLLAIAPTWSKPNQVLIEVTAPVDSDPAAAPAQNDSVPAPTPDLTTPDGIAAAHGCVTQWFGHVLAVVPANMTVLNTDPSLADLPLNRLIALDPKQFLLGSLSEQQFGLLTTSGLSYADLTPDQQLCFAAMLPHPFKVVSANSNPLQLDYQKVMTRVARKAMINEYEKEKLAYEQEVITVPDDDVLNQVRLHGYLNLTYMLSSDDGFAWGFNVHGDKPYSTGDRILASVDLAHDGNSSMVAKFNELLISQQPNNPKPGDLVWRSSELNVPVSLKDVKTVDDLISSLATATHLELYADASYGKRPICIVGSANSNFPAHSIMQALALCVAGTWRKVGPVFVLTNDEAGYGAERNRLNDIVSIWNNRIADVTSGVGLRLIALDWLHNMDFFPGDNSDLTKDQIVNVFGKTNSSEAFLKWSDLPSVVQTAVLKRLNDSIADDEQPTNITTSESAILKSLKPDSCVDTQLSVELALELPNTGVMSFLDYKVDTSKTGKMALPTMDGAVTLTQARRGVLCAPQTADEAKKVVDLLPTLGLNSLYLDVFNNGRTYFPSAVIAPESADSANVLDAAITEAKAKNVAVYAVIDTLCWRKDCMVPRPAIWPGFTDEDVDINGETSESGFHRMFEDNILRSNDPFAADAETIFGSGEGWVSPLDPLVRQVVPALVKEIASTKGLAGLVFQDTAGQGYDSGAHGMFSNPLDLGYSLPNRLAYLRQQHVDPIDTISILAVELPTPDSVYIALNVDIPGFGTQADGIDHSWTNYRTDADISLLKDCFFAALSANPKLPLLMRERTIGFTIDPWNDPKSVDQADPSNSNPFAMLRTSSSSVVLPIVPILQSAPDSVTWMISYFINNLAQNKTGGVILDIENGGIGESIPKTLELLSPSFSVSVQK